MQTLTRPAIPGGTKPKNNTNMKLTIEIPALDRMNELLERVLEQGGVPGGERKTTITPTGDEQPAGAAEPAKRGRKPAGEKPAPEPEPAKPEPAAEKPAAEPPHTIESLTVLGKKLIAVASPAVLRATLDNAGLKGRKIGQAEPHEFDAIATAIETALEENDI